MPDQSILPSHHVARHCSKKDFFDDTMTEVLASTFSPDVDDPGISVNWLEFYNGGFNYRIDAVCRDMSAERDVRSTHQLAILGVQKIRDIGADRAHNLGVSHDPWPENDSHALILGVPLDDTIVHQELADAASTHLVKAVPHNKKF